MAKYDFCGWATKNNLRCSDGRTIMKDAFKHNDGQTVPLVWNHQHNESFNVLGHALLENRNEGVYARCTFNDTESGRNAKMLVEHGDIVALSIYANHLKQDGGNVLHGDIREVSLVLAGANPGALIDSVIVHGEESNEEAVIYTGEEIDISHADDNSDDESTNSKETNEMAEEMTLEETFNTLNENQKEAVCALIGSILKSQKNDDESEGGNETMKHNVFENDEMNGSDTLSHADMELILSDAKRLGSMREAVLAHAEGDITYSPNTAQYGIDGVDFLFPEATNLNPTPGFIKRNTDWVQKVMRSVHHSPFSRIKSVFADITEDEARAKGYIKGKLKKNEVFTLLKRTTTPTTIYKKQKMDRDDVIDITDFNVIAWLKGEMRMMLDEELARAFLVGDGRISSSDDKINELNIRPIWTDDDLFTIKTLVDVDLSTATESDVAKAFIRSVIKSRKDYKGSGNPVLYTTEDVVTDCLLMEDTTGRVIYDSVSKLASVLRVSDIVTVPVMEGLTRTTSDGKTRNLLGIVVNLDDYNVGADRGGAVNMFEDFDIDYNQQKYLIETRCSGALTMPYSAMVFETENKA